MLSWAFPPRSTGGIAAQVSGLSAALAAAGIDAIICNDPGHAKRVLAGS